MSLEKRQQLEDLKLQFTLDLAEKTEPIIPPRQLLENLKQRYVADIKTGGAVASPDAPIGSTTVKPGTFEPAPSDRPIYKERHGDESVMEMMGESLPNVVKNAYNRSLTGMAHQIATGKQPFDLTGYEPGVIEDLAAEIISFVMPLDQLSLVVGGGIGSVAGKFASSAIGKQVAKKLVVSGVKKEVAEGAIKNAALRAIPRMVQGAAHSGGALGAYSGASAAAATKIQTGEYDLVESVKGALHGTALGIILGATGGATAPLAKHGIPGKAGQIGAEIGAFTVGGAAIEGELPTMDDLAHATALVLGLKLQGMATGTVSAAAKRAVAIELFRRSTEQKRPVSEIVEEMLQTASEIDSKGNIVEKEPWELTLKGYVSQMNAAGQREMVESARNNKLRGKGSLDTEFEPFTEDELREEHAVLVKEAADAGKDIPDEVYAEYEHLFEKMPEKGPESDSGEALEGELKPPDAKSEDSDLWGRIFSEYVGRMDNVSDDVAGKNAHRLVEVIKTGQYHDILHPENSVSRSIYELITGEKLPKGVQATKDYFKSKGQPEPEESHEDRQKRENAESAEVARTWGFEKPTRTESGWDYYDFDVEKVEMPPSKSGFVYEYSIYIGKSPSGKYALDGSFPEGKDGGRSAAPSIWNDVQYDTREDALREGIKKMRKAFSTLPENYNRPWQNKVQKYLDKLEAENSPKPEVKPEVSGKPGGDKPSGWADQHGGIEPWNVTAEEFHDMSWTKMAQYYKDKGIIPQKITEFKFREDAFKSHKKYVTEAMEHGKPVSDQVLKDHPELARAFNRRPHPGDYDFDTREAADKFIEEHDLKDRSKVLKTTKATMVPTRSGVMAEKKSEQWTVVVKEEAVRPEYPNGKERWQMTKAEDDVILEDYNNKWHQANPGRDNMIPPFVETHRSAIKGAVKDGKPVPRHVLEEYAGEVWADEAIAKLSEKKPEPKPAEKPYPDRGQTVQVKVKAREEGGTVAEVETEGESYGDFVITRPYKGRGKFYEDDYVITHRQSGNRVGDVLEKIEDARELIKVLNDLNLDWNFSDNKSMPENIRKNVPKVIEDFYKSKMDTPGKRRLYDFLEDMYTVNEIHRDVMEKRHDDWKGNVIKERYIKRIIAEYVDDKYVDQVFDIIKSEKEYSSFDETPTEKPKPESQKGLRNLVDHFHSRIKEGKHPKSPAELVKLAREFDDKLNADRDNDKIYDSYEAAVAREYHDRVKGVEDFSGRMKIAQEMEKAIPTRRRSIEASSLENQQFSTPLTLAEGMYQAAKISRSDGVLEPTAGTGSLIAPVSDWSRVFAVEKGETRSAVLKELGVEPAGPGDYLQWKPQHQNLHTVILTNPPWGSAGRSNVAKANQVPDLAAVFVNKNLRDLADGGRLVALLPTTMIPGESKLPWLTKLANKYDVKAIIMSPPGAYGKGRGTDVNSFVLVVDKVKPPEGGSSPIVSFMLSQTHGKWPLKDHNVTIDLLQKAFPNMKIVDQSLDFDSWQSAIDKIEERPIFNQEAISDVNVPTKAGEAEGRPDRVPTGVGTSGETSADRPSGSGKPRPASVSSESGSESDIGTGAVRPESTSQTDVVPVDRGEVAKGSDGVSTGAGGNKKAAQGSAKRASTVNLGSNTFVGYVPRHPQGHGVKHPRQLIVTRNAVSAGLPDVKHVKLSDAVEDLNKRKQISDEQLEMVARGEDAIDRGHGFLNAADVGVGKTRIAGAHALEWLSTGKANRILYLTARDQNVQDVINELNNISPGGRFPYGIRVIPKDFKESSEIKGEKREMIPKFDKTIYITYSEGGYLPYHKSILELGIDALIGDEAHLLRNKHSKRGGRWVALHRHLKKNGSNRILYLTATPARNVMEYEYLYGLGLWEPGTFSNFVNKMQGNPGLANAAPLSDEMISQLEEGGKIIIGSDKNVNEFGPKEAEQVTRELHAKGYMMSSDLWREGVEFRMRGRDLDPERKEKISKAVSFLNDVRETYHRYAKYNSSLKKAFGIEAPIQALAKDLYFNMRLDDAISEAQEALNRGEQPVISLIRVRGEKLESKEEVDNFETDIETGLPRTLTSLLKDINSKIVDEEGNIEGEIDEAVIARQELYERAKTEWPTLYDPIARIEEAFGADNVAAITGKVSSKKRVTLNDVFQKGERKVAVISGAGKTGISLHDVNGKRRHMIVADYEWASDTFKQEMGRVDRAGQKSSPIISVLHFNSAAERRFIGSLASRMRDLGATAKGAEESTGTAGMEDFEYGGMLHNLALEETWNSIPIEYKDYFAHHKGFRDSGGASAWKIEPDADLLKKFWRTMQTIPVDIGNEIADAYAKALHDIEIDQAKREIETIKKQGARMEGYTELLEQGVPWHDVRKRMHFTGEELRTAELAPGLNLHEVKGKDNSRFGIVTGSHVSDHLPNIKKFISRSTPVYEDFDTPDGRISGVVIAAMKVKSLAEFYKAEGFGQRLTIDNMKSALDAGDKVPLRNGWKVYVGRGGSRTGHYVVDGVKTKDVIEERQGKKYLKFGLRYNNAGGFYHIPEEKLTEFVNTIGLGATETKETGEKIEARRTGGPLPERMNLKTKGTSGEKVTKQDIKNFAKDELGITWRTGHIRAPKETVGIFKNKAGVVRTRDWADIDTGTHEIAHKIYRDFRKDITGLVGFNKEEIGQLDYDANRNNPVEGFAEYLRIYLTGAADPESHAPIFHQSFKGFLKRNPEIKSKIDRLQEMISRYSEQGAPDRVFGQIDLEGTMMKPSLKEKAGPLFRQTAVRFWDKIYPMEWVEKQLRGVKGADAIARLIREGKIDPKTSPTAIARAFDMSGYSQAKTAVLDGTFDIGLNTTGKSLKESIAPVSKTDQQFKEFLAYCYAVHAIELHIPKKGKPRDPGITLADAVYVRDMFDGPTFRAAQKDLVGFQDRVLDYLVESGGISRDVVNHFRELMPAYIPLKRVFESGEWIPASGKHLANLPIAIKRLRGSGRPIVNPLESIIRSTAEIYSIANRMRVGRALVDLAMSTKDGGKWVEKVPVPLRVTRIQLPRLAQELERMGLDMSETTTQEMLDVFTNSQKYLNFFTADSRYRGKDNIVSFWVDGKREFYEVHPDLYKTLLSMDAPQWGAMMKFLSAPARAVRLGATGLQAGFGLITNPIRDAFTFGLQSEFSRGTPDLIAKQLVNKIDPNSKMSQLFKRSGADMSQFLGFDRNQFRQALNKVKSSNTQQKALNVVEHPIDAMSSLIEATKDAFSFTEALPRMAEGEAAYRTGERLWGKGSESAAIMAGQAMREVTVNFLRSGTYGQAINQIIPFWNAAVQGPARMARFAREHPTKAAIKAVASLTVPTVLMYIWNKDEQWYKELPSWQRYGYWNIPIGVQKDGRPKEIVRIPKPFEWGWTFGSAVEMALDYFEHKDPEVVKDFLSEFAEANVPLPPFMNPTAIEIPLELYANYDFFRDREIDPYWEVQYKKPEDRYSGYTTETAKNIGKTFGISPRKIEHLVEKSTGGLGMDIMRAIEDIGKPSRIKSLADIPIVGRLGTHQQDPESRRKRLERLRSVEKGKVSKLYGQGKKAEAEELIKRWNRKYPEFRF